MKSESLELIRTFTPWVMSGITLGWIIVVFVLKKTYAKTEEPDCRQAGNDSHARESGCLTWS
ncbi:hypothetical protein [Vibrio parahaemolyticus]|uniref:hypothetical protein n=1 Tax=Vibrio parahaemolyticus TaxID=670 RepID=UPI0015F1409B|nr:hypothetical protein [Vibrio parahaemolyticus]